MAALYRNLTAALAVEDVVTGVGGDSASAVVFHKLPGAIASALSQHIEGNNPIANAVFERSPQGWAHMAYMVTIGDTFDDNAKIKKLLLAQLTRAFGDQKGFGRANMRVVARFEKTLTAHYEDAEKIPFAVDTVKRFMNTKESEHELREILGVSASIYR